MFEGLKRIATVLEPNDWDTQHLSSLLKGFATKKVLVIGDVGVDRYTIGSVDRISPEAPVPVIQVAEERLKLGLAANVADNVQSLNGEALLVGIVGKDRGAEDFRGLMQEAQLKSEYLVEDSTRRTALKDRIVSESQQLLRVDFETTEPIGRQAHEGLLAKIDRLLPECDAVVLEDYAKGMVGTELFAEVVSRLSADAYRDKPFIVDPNLNRDLKNYVGSQILTPNRKEAESLAHQRIRTAEDLVKAGERILETVSAKWVVVTLGKDGMAIFSKNKRPIAIPTYAREVFDVSGAGDTVVAVMALALSSGARIEDAAILGNLAASVVVGKRGTATVSQSALSDCLEAIH